MRALFIALAAAFTASGCGVGPSYGSGSGGAAASCSASTATETTSVLLSGTSYVPACIKVPAGATITFTNADAETVHTVTTDPGQPTSFDSGDLAAGQRFSETFPTPETVRVHCTYHVAMGMRGTILVQ